MEKKKKRLLLLFVAALLLAAGIATATVGYLWFAPQFFPKHTTYIYVDNDDTADSVYNKIETTTGCSHTVIGSLRWMARYRHYDTSVHTGRYAIRTGESIYHVLSRLLRGYQEPMNLVVGSVRQLDRLSRNIGRQLMLDSADVANLLVDSAHITALGYNRQTLPALFIPNTYEVYWDISAEEFLQRMEKEYERFWNKDRRDKAQALGMTPVEVATLASIVEEETNVASEYPIIAGVYINRLHKGWKLEACPTLKFALGDFTIKRVLDRHIAIDSPYNTYKYAGLPPGLLRTSKIRALTPFPVSCLRAVSNWAGVLLWNSLILI